MSVILRQEKNSPLTFEEMDSNFSFLESSILNIQQGIESGAAISESYIRSLFANGSGILYDVSTGVIKLNPESTVTTINGRLGNVVLNKNDITYNTDDIAEGTTNSYYTDQRVNDAVKNLIQVSNGLTKSETADKITIAPRNFSVRLTGAVIGSATVNNLNDVVIDTIPGSGFSTGGGGSEGEIVSGIGLLVRSPGQLNETQFDGIEFDPSSFTVQATDTYVRISNKITNPDIISVVGRSISGTVFQEDLSIPVESGILITYDADNDSIRIAPRDFTISITGAVSGSAVVSKLSDTIINVENTSGFIEGLTIQKGSVPQNIDPITTLNFSANDFEISAIDKVASISLKDPLTTQDVRDIIGETVVGTERIPTTGFTSETGIILNYDQENNVLEVSPRDFTISIIGAVSGSATVSKLNNTTITVENNNNFIQGLDIQEGSVTQNFRPITTVNFDENDFNISIIDEKATIQLNNPLTTQQVRDIIGETIVGTERIPGGAFTSETGIIVNYDQENNVLEVAPRDFTINLIGDVSGSATVSKLKDISLNTTTTAIKGLNVQNNGNPFLTLAKNLDFSSNFTLTKDTETETVTVDIENIVDASTIRDALNNSLTGAQDGIAISYNQAEEQFSYRLSDLSLSLIGAVTGSGTISYRGNNAQTLTVVTEIGEVGSGLEVRDEGNVKGESIAAINFVGAGVTSSVTVDGQVATVNIPNSPAAEKFILIDNGSANVPNARRLQAGTGIVLNDNGAGGNIVISASGGEILGKIQVEDDGVLIAEEATINLISSQQVFMTAIHDNINNVINILAYSKLDGWYRNGDMDHGEITDKYGNSLDLGDISVGIIEHQIDFGEIA